MWAFEEHPTDTFSQTAPEGRNTLAQDESPGKSRGVEVSPGGTAQALVPAQPLRLYFLILQLSVQIGER